MPPSLEHHCRTRCPRAVHEPELVIWDCTAWRSLGWSRAAYADHRVFARNDKEILCVTLAAPCSHTFCRQIELRPPPDDSEHEVLTLQSPVAALCVRLASRHGDAIELVSQRLQLLVRKSRENFIAAQSTQPFLSCKLFEVIEHIFPAEFDQQASFRA